MIPSGIRPMYAVSSSLHIPPICCLLELPITESTVMIWEILEFLGVLLVDMERLSAMWNSWMQKLLYLRQLTTPLRFGILREQVEVVHLAILAVWPYKVIQMRRFAACLLLHPVLDICSNNCLCYHWEVLVISAEFCWFICLRWIHSLWFWNKWSKCTYNMALPFCPTEKWMTVFSCIWSFVFHAMWVILFS